MKIRNSLRCLASGAAMVALVVGLCLSGFACASRRNISEDFSKSYRSSFNGQRVRQGDTSRSPAPMGVDESRGIRAKYVRTFSPSSDGAAGGAGAMTDEESLFDLSDSQDDDRPIVLSGD